MTSINHIIPVYYNYCPLCMKVVDSTDNTHAVDDLLYHKPCWIRFKKDLDRSRHER